MLSPIVMNFYQLKRLPFERVKSPLSPLVRQGDVALYSRVDGFAQSERRILNWFAEYDGLDLAPHMALVYGPEGSGKTSIAHYIAHLFSTIESCAGRKVSPIATRNLNDYENEHEMDPVQRFLEQLYKHLDSSINISEYSDLDNLFNNHVLINSGAPAHFMRYYQIFERTLKLLESRDIIVPILENICNLHQIIKSSEIFQNARLLLFTTNKPDIVNLFLENYPQSLLVTLHPLSFDDVAHFLEQHWEVVSNSTPHPFDNDGIAFCFGKSEQPFSKVIALLAEMFNSHVTSLEPRLPLSDPDQIARLRQISKDTIYEVWIDAFTPKPRS